MARTMVRHCNQRVKPMSRATAGSQRRVLVSGSRGKSSIVRLLYAAMQAAGLRTYARITGVIPRELGPEGSRTISRSAGAHVEEMRWWLRQLPASAQAIVLENSAITAEFQDLAGRWLRPDVTVLDQYPARPPGVMGPDAAMCCRVLAAGIPERGRVVLPAGLQADQSSAGAAQPQALPSLFLPNPPAAVAENYRAINLGLALATLEQLGLATAPALQAMLGVPADRYDFQVARLRRRTGGDGLFRQRHHQHPDAVRFIEVVCGRDPLDLQPPG